MRYGIDFTVEPIPKRSHGHTQTVKPFYTKKEVMDSVKLFKNPPELREYWRTHKRRSSAKQKEDAKS